MLEWPLDNFINDYRFLSLSPKCSSRQSQLFVPINWTTKVDIASSLKLASDCIYICPYQSLEVTDYTTFALTM